MKGYQRIYLFEGTEETDTAEPAEASDALESVAPA